MNPDMIKKAVLTGGIYAFTSYFLYLSPPVSAIVFVCAAAFTVFDKKSAARDRYKKMTCSFERFLEILSSYTSVPGNFIKALSMSLKEYERIYQKDMFSEKGIKVNNMINANMADEKVLNEFSELIATEECALLCTSLVISLRSGGDLNKTIKETIAYIKEKAIIQREIETVTAQKKTESMIISICPFAILAVFQLSGSGYLDVLYTTSTGRIIMTIAGVLFILSSFLAKRILEIDI